MKPTGEEWEALRAALPGYLAQIEKVLPKFRPGTPQHTLAWRRIESYRMVSRLMEETGMQYSRD